MVDSWCRVRCPTMARVPEAAEVEAAIPRAVMMEAEVGRR